MRDYNPGSRSSNLHCLKTEECHLFLMKFTRHFQVQNTRFVWQIVCGWILIISIQFGGRLYEVGLTGKIHMCTVISDLLYCLKSFAALLVLHLKNTQIVFFTRP